MHWAGWQGRGGWTHTCTPPHTFPNGGTPEPHTPLVTGTPMLLGQFLGPHPQGPWDPQSRRHAEAMSTVTPGEVPKATCKGLCTGPNIEKQHTQDTARPSSHTRTCVHIYVHTLTQSQTHEYMSTHEHNVTGTDTCPYTCSMHTWPQAHYT